MESPDVEILLGMVKELDKELDRYLAGSAQASEAIPHILEMCQQMRDKEISGPVHYWLGAIEHHARQIAKPRNRIREGEQLLASGDFLGIQLLKDIYYLRTQLMSARTTVH